MLPLFFFWWGFSFQMSYVSTCGLKYKKKSANKPSVGMRAIVNHFASIDSEWFNQPDSVQPAEQSRALSPQYLYTVWGTSAGSERSSCLCSLSPQQTGLCAKHSLGAESGTDSQLQPAELTLGLTMSTARSHYNLMNCMLFNYSIEVIAVFLFFISPPPQPGRLPDLLLTRQPRLLRECPCQGEEDLLSVVVAVILMLPSFSFTSQTLSLQMTVFTCSGADDLLGLCLGACSFAQCDKAAPVSEVTGMSRRQ